MVYDAMRPARTMSAALSPSFLFAYGLSTFRKTSDIVSRNAETFSGILCANLVQIWKRMILISSELSAAEGWDGMVSYVECLGGITEVEERFL